MISDLSAGFPFTREGWTLNWSGAHRAAKWDLLCFQERSPAFGSPNYPGGKGEGKGNSVPLVLQAAMLGKWKPGLFQQLGTCASTSDVLLRVCSARRSPSRAISPPGGTWGHGTAGEWLGLALLGSFSIPNNSMFRHLSPSSSLCLCRTPRECQGMGSACWSPGTAKKRLETFPRADFPSKNL